MPKTKKAKEQAELATPIDTLPKSPIEYSFKYRLHKNKDGKPTGLVFLIISATHLGVPIYKFEKTIYFRKLTPDFDQKLNCIKELISEKEIPMACGFGYENCDTQFKLYLGKSDIVLMNRAIGHALDKLKKEIGGLANLEVLEYPTKEHEIRRKEEIKSLAEHDVKSFILKQTVHDSVAISPIEYSFSYRLGRDDNGMLNGLLFLMVSAECYGVPILNYESVGYHSRLFPDLKEKMKIVNEQIGETGGFATDGIVEINCDLDFQLRLDAKAVATCKEKLVAALAQIEQEINTSKGTSNQQGDHYAKN